MIQSRVSKLITVEDILKLVECDTQIFQLYTPEIPFNTLTTSPLRIDKKPSFIIRRLDSHSYWYDYATREKGNFITYVQKLHNLGYEDTMVKIHNDLKTHRQVGTLPPVSVTKKVDLQIKRREFTAGDLEYWQRFGITEKTLRLFKVHAISHFWLNDRRHTCNEPAYAYCIDNSFKVYRPTKEEYRFISGTHAIQGLELLPDTHDVLIIQKSYKDVMLMYEYGYPSIAPQSETTTIPPEIGRSLKSRFKDIYVLYDDDDAGRMGSAILCEQLGATPLFMKDAKDVTDHCMLYGKEMTETVLHNMISNGKQQQKKRQQLGIEDHAHGPRGLS